MTRPLMPALLALSLLPAASLAQTASPLIPYQGHLELSGQSAVGPHDFRFALFATSTADPTCLVTVTQLSDSCGLWWTEQGGVAVNAGAFGVLLGQNKALTSATLAQNALYLAIAVRPQGAADFTLLQGLARLGDLPFASAAHDFTVHGALSVKDVLDVGADTANRPRTIAFVRDNGDSGDAGKISYKPDWDNTALGIVGAGSGNTRKIHLWDDVVVNKSLSTPSLTLTGATPNSTLTGLVLSDHFDLNLTILSYSQSGDLESPAAYTDQTSICWLSKFRWHHNHGSSSYSNSDGNCSVDNTGGAVGSAHLWRLHGYVDQSTDGLGELSCSMRCLRWK
ncbi:MAG: hypothetical protein ABIJ09_24500 [Pseudomonadota bacterium]